MSRQYVYLLRKTRALGSGCPFDLHFLGDTVGLPFHRMVGEKEYVDNITDWALKQFSAHYKDKSAEPSPPPSPSGRRGKGARKISKEAIFHYCYAVLHGPVYREKYAQN